MKFIHYALTAAMTLAATEANAATLTFDGLFGQYGDGQPLGPNMSNNDQTLRYVESGFLLTLHTANGTYQGGYGAHIGDGTGTSQTYNWHDSGDNQYGAYITLSRYGGGKFDLGGFDWEHYGSGLTMSAAGHADVLLTDGTTNTGSATGFANVTSIKFSSLDYSSDGLDNLSLTAIAGVPEPTGWALMIGGFGAMGVAARRRRRIAYA